MFDGLPFDPFALFDDGFGPAEVGVRRRHVVQALVVSLMTVADITSAELLHELRKQERRGRLEAAKQVRAFSSRVFRYAAATARAERDPAQMLLGALIQPTVKHFAAITDPIEFGALLRAIEGYVGDPAFMHALKLTPHVFQRPGELRQMNSLSLQKKFSMR